MRRRNVNTSSTAVAGMYEYVASSPICKLFTSREKGAALCAVFVSCVCSALALHCCCCCLPGSSSCYAESVRNIGMYHETTFFLATSTRVLKDTAARHPGANVLNATRHYVYTCMYTAS